MGTRTSKKSSGVAFQSHEWFGAPPPTGAACTFKNTTDYGTIGKHVIVVIVPLAGWARSGGAFEDQRGHAIALTSSLPS
jgi:hypothetical protein